MSVGQERVAAALAQNEWGELGLQLKHAECPIAVALDAAAMAVSQAHESGLMDASAAERRLNVIGMRRASIAATQEVFGCARDTMSEESRQADEETFTCKLPTGLVENFAFGNINEMIAPQLKHDNNKMGFNA